VILKTKIRRDAVLKIATILFTYNRPWHTQQVIDGLAKNTTMPEKLYIFQDGLKAGQKSDEWLAVNKIIHNVDFCLVEIIESNFNKGLAKSVVDGINYTLKDYNAVIVLEDDCVPMPSFMKYMTQALNYYLDNDKVYVISGYSYDLFEDKKEFESYFIGRMPTWGWGTWKNRWQEYSQDGEILDRIHSDRDAEFRLNLWGGFDLDSMFYDRMKGYNDSWAVFWALKAIELDKYALMPNKTLIKNIGFDGTGRHCGKEKFSTSELYEDIADEFEYPLEASLDVNVKEKAKKVLGNGFCFNNGNPKNEHIIIYGAGHSLQSHCKFLYEKYYVEAIIDKYKRGCFGVIPIYGLDYLTKMSASKIIIMIENRDICMGIAEILTSEYGIQRSNIELGVNLINKCSSLNPFKIGIMGCGSIASQMAVTVLNMRSDIKIQSCASRSRAKAEDFAFKYGIERVFGSYEDMAHDSELDLIYIATPHSEHYPNMMKCIKSCKNVLCEKSFTVNALQAEEVFESADKYGVFVAEAMSISYHPLYIRLKNILSKGDIGEILNVYASFSNKIDSLQRITDPQLAGGTLLELGIYTLNFMTLCLGYEISDIASYSNKFESGVDSSISLIVQYKNGKTAELFCDARCMGNNQGVIYGKNGYIIIDEINRPKKLRVYNNNRDLVEEHHARIGESGLENEIIAAKNAMEKNELECIECSHEHTIKILKIMDSIRKQINVKYPCEGEG